MAISNRGIDLTSGDLWAGIWHMSWPMLIIMVLNFIVGLTDVYVAGLISPEVQAAVGFVSQLYFLIIIVANAVSIGTIALLSRELGARNRAAAVDVARQSLIISIFAALALMMPGLLFHREIVSLLGFPAEIQGIAGDFLKIFALAIGPSYILIISNAVFRAGAEVKKVLFTMSLVSAINIGLNFVLVFGLFGLPRLGYIGIALATALSVTIGMAANFVLFAFSPWKPLYDGPWRVSLPLIRRIVGLSWPAAMLQIAWNAGSLVLYNILGQLGAASITALAAITSGLRIEAIIYLPAFALNMAASVLVGQNMGAAKIDRAEKTGWKMASAGMVVISLMALPIFIWAERIAGIVAKDSAVLAETVRYLRFNMLSEPFMALSTILGGGLQGAGDTRGTMWVVVFAMWIIRLPLAWLLAFVLGYGAAGVWAAMVISMTFQGLIMALRFHTGLWKKIEMQ